MKKLSGAKALNVIFALCSVVVVLIIWIIAYCAVANDYVVPSVGDSFAALWQCFGQKSFWTAFLNTSLRTLYAFCVSFALAAVFAAISSVCNPFKRIFAGIISVVRTIPTMAVTLMLLIWTNPKVAPVIVTCLVLFPMIYSQFIAAIDGVDENLLQMAKVYEIGAAKKLTKIYLPQVAPNVLAQVGADISFGIKLTVSAEVLSYTAKSLGGAMQQARLYVEMPTFAALTIVCIAFGLIAEALFANLGYFTYRWRKKEGSV